mgnify:FL=1
MGRRFALAPTSPAASTCTRPSSGSTGATSTTSAYPACAWGRRPTGSNRRRATAGARENKASSASTCRRSPMPMEPEMRGGWLTGWRVYRQVAARLRERITTGVYQAGSILPSEAALSAEFRVARNTIRRALEALEADGLILTVPSQRSPGPGGRPDRHRPLPVPGDRERARAEDQTGRPRAGRSTAERGRAGLVVRRVASHRTARLRRAGTRRPDRLPPREGPVRLPTPKTSWDV